MDRSTLAKLRLLVGQLVIRASAQPGRERVPVAVTLSDHTVHAAVGDETENDPPVLDWSLLLVSRIADSWGVGRGVWFELERSPQSRSRGPGVVPGDSDPGRCS